MKEVQPGKYQHYKGGLYEVTGVAMHSETEEKLVIYKQLYDSEKYPAGTFWARPKEEFLETAGEVLRFKYLGKESE